MEGGAVILPFDLNDDVTCLSSRWMQWKRSIEILIDAKAITDPHRKYSILLHFGGRQLQDLFFSLPESSMVPKDSDRYKHIINLLDQYFMPKSNSLYERHLLRQLKQKTGESTDNYITRLRLQTSKCNFEDLTKFKLEEMCICDQLVEGCKSSELRKRLLEKRDLTVTEAADIARSLETVAKQTEHFENPTNDLDVNRINRSVGIDSRKCFRCGKVGHLANSLNCPARNSVCKKCNLKGHVEKCCKTAAFKTNRKNNYLLEDNDYDYSEGDYTFQLREQPNESCGNIPCMLGGVKLEFLIDSGSSCNVINHNTWEYLKKNHIKLKDQQNFSGKRLFPYGQSEPLEVLGEIKTLLEIKNKKILVDVVVIKGRGPPLLGRSTAMELGVLKVGYDVNSVRVANVERPQPLGKLKNFQLCLQIDKNVKPVVQPLRKIPIPLKMKVEERLTELRELDVIEKVDGPTSWVSPLVVVPKGDQVRLCVDMRRANRAVVQPAYPLPTIDDLLAEIGGSKIFSKLDLKMAFHQIELEAESREITTFNTHVGLFRFKRLMFGINCAPQEFQKIIDNVLRDCEGTIVYIDDILVFGEDRQVHQTRLAKVIDTLEKNGLQLNKEKCEMGRNSVTFLGHVISADCIKPILNRVEAIQKCRAPTNVSELRGFLGLVNYVSKFIPNVATLTDPLRQLTHKQVPFKWVTKHQTVFENIKEILASDLNLGYYKPEDKTIVMTDASPVGLGALLIQTDNSSNPRIICYISKSLTPTERRYSQLEKEALGLVWACERLKLYLIGKKFELFTDHKPLEVIFGERSKPCARIERWLLRLQSFDYKVIYVEGKNNIADPLSRLSEGPANTGLDTEQYLYHLSSYLAPKALPISEIRKESNEDEIFARVFSSLQSGQWANDDIALKPYKVIQSELSELNGLLLKGTRMIIPKVMRSRVLELAHEGHPGIVEMKSRLRSKVWWPKIDRDAENSVRKCIGCQITSKLEKPEEMKSTNLPEKPWESIAIDILGPFPNGLQFLVIVDYFSRFVEVLKLNNTLSSTIIRKLDETFTRYGYPEKLTSDNGRNLVSNEMEAYLSQCGIVHHRVTPLHPQANGTVERLNPGITRRMQIANALNQDWEFELNKYLLMYRNHVHQTTGASPSELFFGRKLRDKLPSIANSQVTTKIREEIVERDKLEKLRQKEYADKRRGAKGKDLNPGDQVLIKQPKVDKFSTNFGKSPMEVIKKVGNAVIVKDKSGRIYSRNSTFLKPFITDMNGKDQQEKKEEEKSEDEGEESEDEGGKSEDDGKKSGGDGDDLVKICKENREHQSKQQEEYGKTRSGRKFR